jgi:ankyrin repeat protein
MTNPWDVSEWNKGLTTLHIACSASHGDLDIVKVLLQTKSNVNQTNSYGVTPLMVAVIAGHDHIVEYLLDNGANANLETIARDSPLSLALYISGEREH